MIIKTRLPVFFAALLLLVLGIASVQTSSITSPTLDTKSDAKKPYALLYGTVYDKNDRPVYGVKVSIRRATGKRAKWELYSDHVGEFAQRVPAGKADYIVTAEVKTPKGQPKPEVRVHVDNEERRDFSLHLK